MKFKNANEQAYRSIKEMIAQYQLIPGHKMTYSQLAERLNMSKTPITNALNRLEQEEFVIALPNKGFFVKEIDVDEVKELFEVRKALQVLSVEHSIRNYRQDLMDKIKIAMMQHREYCLEGLTRKRQAADATFHLAIAEMGGNKYLGKVLKQVFERIYLRHRVEGISPERLVAAVKEHEEIFNTIKEKNLSKARACVRRHEEHGRIATTNGIISTKENYYF